MSTGIREEINRIVRDHEVKRDTNKALEARLGELCDELQALLSRDTYARKLVEEIRGISPYSVEANWHQSRIDALLDTLM